ncbi:hypothetical protein RJ639_002809 [Escallonia herrerae]|uniref:Reverse transcriptase Ty1/copia-type domain-containing protein n=1 Tax=Escallonia herrerae TaxID=1293975 RepID=A0AA88W2F9_9ASTE|nr:hypothetical protein RJ639_002809 [Escallonia herrerae]
MGLCRTSYGIPSGDRGDTPPVTGEIRHRHRLPLLPLVCQVSLRVLTPRSPFQLLHRALLLLRLLFLVVESDKRKLLLFSRTTYVTLLKFFPPASSTPTNGSSDPRYPLANFVSCKSFSAAHTQFLDAVSSSSEPHSYKTTSHDPKCRAAMRAKIDTLEANGTWTIKDLRLGKKPIGSKWVYKIKFNSNESIERYKARVLVRGDTQVELYRDFCPSCQNGERPGDIFLSVLVYVDDLILAGNNSTAYSLFKKYLNNCFKLKDLGPLKYFLGIEGARGPRGLFLSQRKYALDILSESCLSASKPAAFPMEQNHGLALVGGPLLSDPGPYLRLIGRLVYLTITRPDICYVVHVLSQFMQSPHS